MVYSRSPFYCGPPSFALRKLLSFGSQDEVRLWFADCPVYYVHKARIAIRRACDLLHIGCGDEILAPAYNCGTEISALLDSGVSVTLYDVEKSSLISLEEIVRRRNKKTKAIYVTHYFGFPQPVDVIKRYCADERLYLIEDCALALFSCDGKTKLGSVGDISVYNFPKTLPVPDGGALVINNPDLTADNWKMRTPPVLKVSRQMLPLIKRRALHISSGSALLHPLFWAILKRTRSTTNHTTGGNIVFPDMPAGYYYDQKLNDRGMSKITKRMMGTFDMPEIVRTRRANFVTYLRVLSGVKNVEPLYKELPDGVCPLHFPIIVHNRVQLCQALNNLSIDATAWWSGYHRSLPWTEYVNACFLKDNILTLPVHQQLNGSHIEFIAYKLLNIVKEIKVCA